MDWFRVLLLTSVAMVMVTLLARWSTFNQTHPPLQYSTPESVTQNTAADDVIDPPELSTSRAQDAPLPATPKIQHRADPINAEKSRSPNANVVQVQTDVLRLDINLRGGDIEYLALPQYPKQQGKDAPFVLMRKDAQRRFLAQSGLLGLGSSDKNKRLVYQTNQDHYILKENQDVLRIVLQHVSESGITVEKSFTFSRGNYKIHIDYQITNRSSNTWRAVMFGQLQRGDYPDPHQNNNTLSPASFLGIALYTPEKPYTKIKIKNLRKAPIEHVVEGGWIALVQHYFVSAWIPPAKETHTYRAKVHNGNRYVANWISPQYEFLPNSQTKLQADFYAGPKIREDLAALSPILDRTVDYGFLWWIASPLSMVLTWLYGWVHNWGAAIIMLTFLVKLVFFPLSNIGYQSMARMRLMQPKVMAIRERFAQDRPRLSQELMALYKKEGINPMGGCLPILVQMPVFLALYWVLLESVELRHAPFVGWIMDLSVKDPWYVLPVLMGLSMFLQQKMNPAPPDPMQAAVLRWLPPIFTVFFMFFPAGLVLYWLVNNILSMLQQFWVNYQTTRD